MPLTENVTGSAAAPARSAEPDTVTAYAVLPVTRAWPPTLTSTVVSALTVTAAPVREASLRVSWSRWSSSVPASVPRRRCATRRPLLRSASWAAVWLTSLPSASSRVRWSDHSLETARAWVGDRGAQRLGAGEQLGAGGAVAGVVGHVVPALLEVGRAPRRRRPRPARRSRSRSGPARWRGCRGRRRRRARRASGRPSAGRPCGSTALASTPSPAPSQRDQSAGSGGAPVAWPMTWRRAYPAVPALATLPLATSIATRL